MFTQTLVIPLRRPWSLAELRTILSDFETLKEVPATNRESAFWMAGEGGFVFRANSGSHAGVCVELFNRPWPDHMGDPHGDSTLFAAWNMHLFGRTTFPLSFVRAAAMSSSDQERSKDVFREHCAFVRCNLGYIFGSSKDDPIVPADRNPHAELQFLAKLAQSLLKGPGAGGWFAPNGEVFFLPEDCREAISKQSLGEFVPSLWVKLRHRSSGKHFLLETVGLGAIGAGLANLDHQVVLSDDHLSIEQAETFLKQVSHLDTMGCPEVLDGPILGPGGRWVAQEVEDDGPPPRTVVRWIRENVKTTPPDTATANEDEAKVWEDHLERYLGKSPTVFHELVSDTVHLDVLHYPPTKDRPFYVLVTQGMSSLPMTVPEGLEEFRYAELMIALPADWPVDDKSFSDERNFWPVRVLKFIARLPHLYETWIGLGHTIPNGEPAEPYASDTALCGAIIGSPVLLPEAIRTCELAKDKSVNLYAIYPLYNDEMNYKLKEGSDALFEKFAKRKGNELIDPQRRSVLAKRFWII